MGSLRLRLMASSFVWIGATGIVAALMISGIFQRSVERSYHDELNVRLEELAALTALRPDGQPYLLRPLSDPRFAAPGSGLYWQVERPGFRTLVSPSLGPSRLKNDLARDIRVRSDWIEGPTGTTLGYGRLATMTSSPQLKLLMASDRRPVEKTIAEFNRALDVDLALFALVLLLGGALQLTYVLRPLGKLVKDVSDVREGRTRRMPEEYPDEIRPLVTELNGLLDAQAEMVRRGRMLAGRLAHGLRTPLAIILDEAEQLESQGHSGSAAVISHEIQRVTRQLDYHLARAGSAGASSRTLHRAPLRATLDSVLIAMRRVHRERDVNFEMVPAPDLIIACDPGDLTEILSNLLDNAGKWATARCLVSWTHSETSASIMIDDDGKGIPRELRERAFAVGERLGDPRPGSGLGLAIARDLSRYNGGEITLGVSPARGLRATVTLSLATDG